MKQKEITTLAIVGGAVIAIIYLFSQSGDSSSGTPSIAGGIGQGAEDAGSGIGDGAEALGIGGGAAAVIWAFGNFIFPGL